MEPYDVALLIERELNDLDARQVVALHEGLEDTEVRYHLLLPVESDAATLAASMSALGGGQLMPIAEPDALLEVEEDLKKAGWHELDASAALLRATHQVVTAELTEDDPIDALVELVGRVGADEVIILTESHVVQEFLHVDWTSRAKRKLEIPTLHLLEHLPFDAQR